MLANTQDQRFGIRVKTAIHAKSPNNWQRYVMSTQMKSRPCQLCTATEARTPMLADT